MSNLSWFIVLLVRLTETKRGRDAFTLRDAVGAESYLLALMGAAYEI